MPEKTNKKSFIYLILIGVIFLIAIVLKISQLWAN